MAQKVRIMLEKCKAQRDHIARILHKAKMALAQKNPCGIPLARVKRATPIDHSSTKAQVHAAPLSAKFFTCAEREAPASVTNHVKHVWMPKGVCTPIIPSMVCTIIPSIYAPSVPLTVCRGAPSAVCTCVPSTCVPSTLEM